MKLEISQIRTDGGTQIREKLDSKAIEDYAEDMKAGDAFPAVVVFFDGETYWLADGFHRLAAALKAGFTHFHCDVKEGTQRDAVLYAIGANKDHGLRRFNVDKQHAVERMLADEEWSHWSDNEISKHCGVSQKMVSEYRRRLKPGLSEPTSTVRVCADGRTMNVANIGKGKKAEDTEEESSEPLLNDARTAGTVMVKEEIKCEKCLKHGAPFGKPCEFCEKLRQEAKKPKRNGVTHEPTEEPAPDKAADSGPQVLKDTEGHIVPPLTIPAFQTLEKYRTADSLCRQLQALVDEISRLPGGEQLCRCLQPTGTEDKKINKSEHLNGLIRDLKGTRPYSVCPYCHEKDPAGCKGCNGLGWVTRLTWNGTEDKVKGRLAPC